MWAAAVPLRAPHDGAVDLHRPERSPFTPFSDIALHGMGAGLADDISQGEADGDQFRTAPLWGIGQRLFFLHDGRTPDLTQAITPARQRGPRPTRSSTTSMRFHPRPAEYF